MDLVFRGQVLVALRRGAGSIVRAGDDPNHPGTATNELASLIRGSASMEKMTRLNDCGIPDSVLDSGSGAGKPSLQATLDEFESLLRERYPDEINNDAKRFRDAVVTGIMRRFRLIPGRPRVERLNKAETLRAKGHKLDHICRIIEAEYAHWPTYRRMSYRQSIQAALRQRNKRRQKTSRETMLS